jgi:hypothetical protein
MMTFLRLAAAAFLLGCAPAAWAQDDEARDPVPVKIKPKRAFAAASDGERLLRPDTSLIDAPTTAVLDYGGYASATRFFSDGGLLQHAAFGVFHRLNIGASLNIDKLVGAEKPTRVRAPNVQVKYRFYDGDHWIPSFAVGFDGQGALYNAVAKRYNHRHRGFYVAASQELGLPGLSGHPSFNISDFDSNSVFASLPVSYNIRDRVLLMVEWDNINNFRDSRFNAGLRAYVTPGLHLDFALRAMGAGGHFSNGLPRGPERIVQLKYSGNF